MENKVEKLVSGAIGALFLALTCLGLGMLELAIRGKMLAPWETYGGFASMVIVGFLMIFGSGFIAFVLIRKAFQ